MDSGFNRSAINWVNKLGDGDKRAQEIMFAKYFDQLIRLARSKMRGMNEAPRDAEDVALSAVRSFCSGIEGGEFVVSDESALWAVLFKITTRKACAERRRQYAKKRGGDKTTVRQVDADEDSDVFQAVAGREPSPELAQATADAADELLAIFENQPKQRQIIELKLRGVSNREIADATGLIMRTVLWHLQKIREKLELTKDFEYLFANLFDGSSLDYLAKWLEKPADKVRAIVEKALELCSKEESPDVVEMLREYFFDYERFLATARQNETRARVLR